ncbi:MAG: carboxypeptidase regulatory-like domain-containing protein [Candidatus Omnitrophica bacterium]|nr:carboxypeptidase regulatory-like domain-containing protein [Candidatus Omnitrophota bacterium]
MKKMSLAILIGTLGLIGPALTAQAATISGTVKYEGKVPKFREIKMEADPVCLTKHANPVFPDFLLLGEGNTLGNVFVRVLSGLPKTDYPTPTKAAVLDQKGCMYTPHVLAVMVNQPIDILNPDGTLHNVHAVGKINKQFNIAMPKFRKKITQSFAKPEVMVKMKCDVHPWMGAYIAVMEHPYFAVSEADGQFKIDNLPAGEYEIEAWHEKLGTQKVRVSLAEGETEEINFTFSKP